jgi:hypothetical protein
VQRKHFPLAVALVLLVLTAALLVWPDTGTVTVKNVSSSAINGGSLTTSHQAYTISPLGPGDTQAITFSIWGDSDYDVSLHFASGRSIRKRLGYVTKGMHMKDELQILDSDVVLQR